MKNSLNSTTKREDNPFKDIWIEYIQGRITLRDLQQKTRSWRLNRVSSYAYQKMPPPPSCPKKNKNKWEGWLEACHQRSLENLVHRLQLSILLRDLQSGRLAAEPGKKEQIQILLEEFPHHRS